MPIPLIREEDQDTDKLIWVLSRRKINVAHCICGHKVHSHRLAVNAYGHPTEVDEYGLTVHKECTECSCTAYQQM